MKFMGTYSVKEYNVIHKKRTFFQWLFNKPAEVLKTVESSRLKDIKFDSLEDLLSHFIETKVKGQSSNFCISENGVCFFLDKGKGKIAVQASTWSDDDQKRTLEDLTELFGNEQTVNGRKYKIVFNVTNRETQAKISREKNKGG